jgi:uncharacterized membrane protein
VSDLVAIAYPDEAAATRGRSNLSDAIEKGAIEIEDVLLLVRGDDGKFEIRQGSSGVGAAAAGGAMWGGVIGLVLLVPLLGMAMGAAAGAAAWKAAVGDSGIDESFVSQLQEQLAPGTAALVLLVRRMSPEQVLAMIKERGHVIQSSLDDSLEQQLDAALRAATPESR